RPERRLRRHQLPRGRGRLHLVAQVRLPHAGVRRWVRLPGKGHRLHPGGRQRLHPGWYSVVNFDALKLPREKRLVWPVVSWLGLAGCLALFASLPVWAPLTAGAVLTVLTLSRWLILRHKPA